MPSDLFPHPAAKELKPQARVAWAPAALFPPPEKLEVPL
ncbi:hypothetical protein X949_5946 [Burkholderia pseudomallei MSHR5609]|nr:hypothetical protein X949_5946 [Burkholderia pseudomallei MSHR5609]